METKEIRHKGQVVKIDRQGGDIFGVKLQKITVSFLSQGGCGSCKARGKCGMVESDRREVEVYAPVAEAYNLGDEVTISVTMGMGRMAVVLAYVVPLVLMIILMALGAVLNLAEWGVALMGLVGVALYYCVLYLNRNRIDKKINFTITN
ncbi:MAG: SoxR reducing system RseC family protein [Rikenellaceae bacterium]